MDSRLSMRHVWQGASLLGVVAACIFASQAAMAQTEPVPAAPEAGVLAYPFPLTDKKALKAKPSDGQVFQLDRRPIGNCKPLLLIHGGGGESKPICRWGTVIDTLHADRAYLDHYKTFIYRYNSKFALDKTAPQLKQALRRLYKDCGDKRITILALSMGGNLSQRALTDPEVDKCVERVISMGTPYHGSPLFSSDWFQYSLDSSRVLPWARTVHALDYRLFFGRHMNYLSDLKWDNADQLIPEVGRFHSLVGVGPRGELTVAKDANPTLAKINTEGAIKKDKFVTYAGYVNNPFLMTKWRHRLETTILAPYSYFRIRILAHLGREHPALFWLNREMSKLRINPQADDPNPYAYKLNDGITPVNSAIWLPSSVLKETPVLEEPILKDLDELCDVRLARVFRNVDHISFMDGKPSKGRNMVADEMHPEQGKRPLLDWLLHDLMLDNVQKRFAPVKSTIIDKGKSVISPGQDKTVLAPAQRSGKRGIGKQDERHLAQAGLCFVRGGVLRRDYLVPA